MKGPGERCTRKHLEAVLALVAEPTVKAAADKVGISETTMWRRMQREDFREQYAAARRQVVDVALVNLQQTAGQAVETLRRNLACGQPSVEVRAATAIVEHVLKAVELEELEERIRALEAHHEHEPPRGR